VERTALKVPDDAWIELYGPAALSEQRRRYRQLEEEYSRHFGEPGLPRFASSPGRTELGGNHTDHNHGKVLCAAVCIDTVALFEARSDNRVKVKSSAFPGLFEVDLASLEPKEGETGKTPALIRGVAAGLKMRGFHAGGFNAVVHSGIGIGSGLSSSASFEVLIGSIYNILYNGSRIDPVTLAKTGQYAENVHFGKPCGLMDQLACAVGGILSIDFKDSDSPVVEKIAADFDRMPYLPAVVHTGGSHAGLTGAYASIPEEMRRVAGLFGRQALRDVREEDVRSGIDRVRTSAGDRALLRALHFFEENRRVDEMARALKTGDFESYLRLAAESGASSATMLQNIVAPGGRGQDQPAALAIGVSNDFFRAAGGGVSRIHGGGFAGTIQSYVPKQHLEAYTRVMERLFGEGCVMPLRIRMRGVTEVSSG
jgi:galactokinase